MLLKAVKETYGRHLSAATSDPILIKLPGVDQEERFRRNEMIAAQLFRAAAFVIEPAALDLIATVQAGVKFLEDFGPLLAEMRQVVNRLYTFQVRFGEPEFRVFVDRWLLIPVHAWKTWPATHPRCARLGGWWPTCCFGSKARCNARNCPARCCFMARPAPEKHGLPARWATAPA